MASATVCGASLWARRRRGNESESTRSTSGAVRERSTSASSSGPRLRKEPCDDPKRCGEAKGRANRRLRVACCSCFKAWRRGGLSIEIEADAAHGRAPLHALL